MKVIKALENITERDINSFIFLNTKIIKRKRHIHICIQPDLGIL